MARLSAEVARALGNWWPLAQHAGFGGFTATDAVIAASDIAHGFGETVSFAETRSIAILYGYARRMSSASDALGAAAPPDPIDNTMVAIPPWARDDPEMNTTPTWHVTFEFAYLDQGGNFVTDQRTSVFEMTLPDTVGELADAVTEDAQNMADKYGFQLVSAIPTMILAV